MVLFLGEVKGKYRKENSNCLARKKNPVEKNKTRKH